MAEGWDCAATRRPGRRSRAFVTRIEPPRQLVVAGGSVLVAGHESALQQEPWIHVVKLLRAHGGCLGVRRRGRAWKTAISSGELSNER
jgi:hypothetical protein